MYKPFSDIQTDAEYLRAVGLAVDDIPHEQAMEMGYGAFNYYGPYLALHDTDPARKWENLANVIRVLGPEMDRRLFSHECFIGTVTHTDLLEAFYNAHAQGDEVVEIDYLNLPRINITDGMDSFEYIDNMRNNNAQGDEG